MEEHEPRRVEEHRTGQFWVNDSWQRFYTDDYSVHVEYFRVLRDLLRETKRWSIAKQLVDYENKEQKDKTMSGTPSCPPGFSPHPSISYGPAPGLFSPELPSPAPSQTPQEHIIFNKLLVRRESDRPSPSVLEKIGSLGEQAPRLPRLMDIQLAHSSSQRAFSTNHEPVGGHRLVARHPPGLGYEIPAWRGDLADLMGPTNLEKIKADVKESEDYKGVTIFDRLIENGTHEANLLAVEFVKYGAAKGRGDYISPARALRIAKEMVKSPLTSRRMSQIIFRDCYQGDGSRTNLLVNLCQVMTKEPHHPRLDVFAERLIELANKSTGVHIDTQGAAEEYIPKAVAPKGRSRNRRIRK